MGETEAPKQKAFWLRADLARRLGDLLRARRAAGRPPATEREALNAAVERYLEAEAPGATRSA
jgi:hypothetical protein